MEEHSLREVRSKIALLKAVCDADSASEIDCYIERVLCHPTLSRRENFRVDYRGIAESTRSAWAQEEASKRPKVDVPAMRRRYGLEGINIADQFIRPESFFYRCGLVFIPDANNIIGARSIVDGGAYRGESAVVMRCHHPNAQVHAFEPDARNFSVLTKVARETKFGSGITPVQVGLGASTSVASLTGAGHEVQLSRTGNRGCIQVTSIDNYAVANRIAIGFFKLDLEGVEFDAVKGATVTLKRDRPAFSVAIYHNPVDFLEIGPFIASSGMNYHLMVRHLHPQLSSFFGEFMLIGYPLN